MSDYASLAIPTYTRLSAGRPSLPKLLRAISVKLFLDTSALQTHNR